MKKVKWISFGCLLGIILATGSCKETLQNALGKDISVRNPTRNRNGKIYR